MATMLSISDLANILAALKEVAKPYQLGIQLKIDSSELDTIEKDHPRGIDRQKTEVIKYWLRNSPDASWTTLANAVERMGGHARLVETLREKERRSEKPSSIPQVPMPSHETSGYLHEDRDRKERKFSRSCSVSEIISLDTTVPRNILLLGKMGHGKSTVGSRMLGNDGWFKINDQQCPQTSEGYAMLKSASQCKNYKLQVDDHAGLFEGACSIDTLSDSVPEKLNLVVFVLKCGCSFDESEAEMLKSVMREWKINGISALVLTHCERLLEEEREKVIEQFKKDHPSVAELMGKGILAVGFPESSLVEAGTELSDRVKGDKAKLRRLIYSCEKSVFRISPQPPNIQPEPQPRYLPQSGSRQPPQNENRQPPHRKSRQHFCCSIL